MWLFLEALDVWMFRDGKPFNAGEGHFASTLFPPSAHTLQGALRTLLLDLLDTDIKTYVEGRASNNVYTLLGNPRDPNNLLGQFTLLGPFVAKHYEHGVIERYLPLPEDVTAAKGANLQYRNTALKTLYPVSDTIPVGEGTLSALSIQADDEPLDNCWIAENEFANYLNGHSLTVNDIAPEEELFVREYRAGNALRYDKRRVNSEDGMLYSASFIRPQKDVGLLVWLPDIITDLLPDEGHFRMGGEGRVTSYKKVKDAGKVLPGTPLVYDWQANHRLKIVFLTPAYFSQGWLPQEAWFSNFLISAAPGRPLKIGGWDLVKKEPRSVRRYIVPGSVYYFEFEDDLRPDTLLLSEQPENELPLFQLGYGHIAVGIW